MRDAKKQKNATAQTSKVNIPRSGTSRTPVPPRRGPTSREAGQVEHLPRLGGVERRDIEAMGKEMHRLIARLYPICRSITGDGVRETLKILQEHIHLEIREIPTGTRVFDWTVPKEWNIRDAYVKDSRGRRVIDFRKSNLHVVGYSAPFRGTMRLAELRKHLFTLPDHPEWIPYRTSYYEETWGFCLSHRQWLDLKEDEYEVCIDSELKDGRLTYGECVLQGRSDEEILISCHVCHPSLCNDNLSGIALSTFLAKHLGGAGRRHTCRFLFVPGTIGSITWLAQNEAAAQRVKHGVVLAGVGDAGKPTYKKSRRGNAEIDWAFEHVLKQTAKEYEIMDFIPYGYDERQYCSPGFDLPVGCLMRSPFGKYPEYHTSADNPDFVKPESLAHSFLLVLGVLDILENGVKYVSRNPKCEPQLGRRGLYEAGGDCSRKELKRMAMLWVLNLSDGRHSLLEIADRAGMQFEDIRAAAERLVEAGLLKKG